MARKHLFKKEKSGKREVVIPQFEKNVEKDIEKRLKKICDDEKKEVSEESKPLKDDIIIIKNEDDEKIDLVTGDVYHPLNSKIILKQETSKNEKSKSEEIKIRAIPKKEEKESFVKSIFPKRETKTVRMNKSAILSDITVVCIELTYGVEEIKKLLNATRMNLDTKLFKIIFFGNVIYSTDIQLCSAFSLEEIMKFVVKIKQVSETYSSSEILFYDALEESFSLYRENKFLGQVKVKISDDEFDITRRKYMYITSGKDVGSVVEKIEIQSLLSDVRKEDVNHHVILTNIEMLPKVSSLGFRTIRIIKL